MFSYKEVNFRKYSPKKSPSEISLKKSRTKALKRSKIKIKKNKYKSNLTPKQLNALLKGRQKLMEIRKKRKNSKLRLNCKSSCKTLKENTRKQRLKKINCYFNC
jgi:hypothetical protein